MNPSPRSVRLRTARFAPGAVVFEDIPADEARLIDLASCLGADPALYTLAELEEAARWVCRC